jgi:hypothetical protein
MEDMPFVAANNPGICEINIANFINLNFQGIQINIGII